MEKNYFEELNNINVSGKVEQKNGLNYLSWAYAWGEIKKLHPDTNYKVYENNEGWNYFTDGKTAWVKVSVICEGIEHIEYLPIMDNRNNSIPVDNITSFDVNKSIQRALTKAVARHGLGLYVYAGEDLPESLEETPLSEKVKPQIQQTKPATTTKPLATESQKKYMFDLMDQKGKSVDELNRLFTFDLNSESLTRDNASKVIDYLKQLPDAPKGDIKTKDVAKSITIEDYDVKDDDDYPF